MPAVGKIVTCPMHLFRGIKGHKMPHYSSKLGREAEWPPQNCYSESCAVEGRVGKAITLPPYTPASIAELAQKGN